MIRDYEQKAISEMAEAMKSILREFSINPLEGMTLVGYAARQAIGDISNCLMINSEQAVIASLGAMLPEDYIKALASLAQPKQPSNGCGGSM